MYIAYYSVCLFHHRKLEHEWQVEPQIIDELEAFTCLIYGYPREMSVNTVRSLMLKKMVGEDARLTSKSKVDLSRLPRCRDNLVPHIQRVNHRLAYYKRSDRAGSQGLVTLGKDGRRRMKGYWNPFGSSIPSYHLLSSISSKVVKTPTKKTKKMKTIKLILMNC